MADLSALKVILAGRADQLVRHEVRAIAPIAPSRKGSLASPGRTAVVGGAHDQRAGFVCRVAVDPQALFTLNSACAFATDARPRGLSVRARRVPCRPFAAEKTAVRPHKSFEVDASIGRLLNLRRATAQAGQRAVRATGRASAARTRALPVLGQRAAL